ncbi:uncharacterized protein LOC141702402 [Apium graveolens]|uniref:uncharacterized protein LOC141702402 n=1 Tax=Apium graveolens TaxID=4045 RepID=UPI003D7A5CE0
MNIASTSTTAPPEMLALPPPPTVTPQVSSRTFNLKMKDDVQNSEVIEGKLSINNVEAKVSIDSGATKSFISETFASRLNGNKKDMSEAMNIVISNQEKIHVSQFFPQCEIDISGRMDWLEKNNSQIDCRSKKVYLRAKYGSKVIFKGHKQEQLFLTAIQASKLLRKGCEAYLAYVVDSDKEVPSMEEIPVVREFPDVFPEELPRMPPDRQIEFEINLAQTLNSFRRDFIEWNQQR